MFPTLPAVIGIGALLSRFRAAGMARTMFATAGAQVLVAIIAIAAGLASPGPRALLELAGLTAFFSAAWLTSAWLFRKSALRSRGGNPC